VRKPGQRANLSAGKVIGAALDVLQVTGLENFSARQVAKKLGVSSAAIYAHIDGGLGGLKTAMVYVTLHEVGRPYGPNDTPAGYLRELFLRLLKAIHGNQPLAQLIAIELSADYLVCPIFADRLFAAALAGGNRDPNSARVLDLAMAAVLGMIMVEGETLGGRRVTDLMRGFYNRLKTFPPNDVPTLLAHKDDLAPQIGRRVVAAPKLLIRTAHWYAEPLIAALKLKGPVV
jgi:AcrR family transcriptional regulator